MRSVPIGSVGEPISSDPETVWLAARLVSRADLVGLVPDPGLGVSVRLDRALVLGILTAFAEAGVAADATLRLQRAETAADYRDALAAAVDQTEGGLLPAREWPRLVEVLGDEVLADLVGTTVGSVGRYAAGTQPTPDAVASRLHFVALVVSDLAGSYNDLGIRRWFSRRRHRLGDRSPGAILGAGFDPGGDDARRLRQLAGELLACGAT